MAFGALTKTEAVRYYRILVSETCVERPPPAGGFDDPEDRDTTSDDVVEGSSLVPIYGDEPAGPGSEDFEIIGFEDTSTGEASSSPYG